VVQSLPGEGHAALMADVARTDTLKALRDEIERRFGRLDVLVNAAGFTQSVPHADLEALDDDLIDRMFAVNWRGQFDDPHVRSAPEGLRRWLDRVDLVDRGHEWDRFLDPKCKTRAGAIHEGAASNGHVRVTKSYDVDQQRDGED
jgi:NAD(P)-dependent dehydrogenase (short-subunit alcohol dehydrogenase family)